jgi:phosphatidate cytidylyltransferase
MLRWRLLLSVVIVAALAGLCWLDAQSAIPGLWLLPALAAFTLTATAETLGLARAGGLRPLGGVVHPANLLLVLGPWLPVAVHLAHGRNLPLPISDMVCGNLITSPDWPLVVLGVAVCLLMVGEVTRYKGPGGILASVAAGVLAMVYVGVMLRFAVLLRLECGVGAIASWIITVKMGDVGAYTVGRLIGRHKLCPRLSPGKTIEGAVGAVVFTCAGAWDSLAWLAPAVMARHPWAWLPYGLVLGIAGMLGDLAESMLKRDVGLKDSSRWMPGFGGVLDILDSLLLSAPVAWLCWSLGMLA